MYPFNRRITNNRQTSIFDHYSFYAKPYQQQAYNINDLAAYVDELPDENPSSSQNFADASSHTFKYSSLIRNSDFKLLLLLPLIGICSAITVFSIDYFSLYLHELRMTLVLQYSGLTSFLIFYLSGIICATISVLITVFVEDIDTFAIPELKTILSGVNIYKYLRADVFFPKVVAFITAVVSGMSLGRDGPYVHMACIIATIICKKVHYFKEFNKSNTLRKKVLSATCAGGLSATSGAAIGGVLYSLELTSSHFQMSNLWRAFYCAAWTMMAHKFIRGLFGITPLYVKFDDVEVGLELVNFVGIGILAGFLGGYYCKLVAKFIMIKRNWNLAIFDKFYLVWIIYTMLAVISWCFPMMMNLDRTLSSQLQTKENLSVLPEWRNSSQYVFLVCIFFFKFTFCILLTCVAMPVGIGSAYSLCGSTMGRLYGELLATMFSGIHPRTYALVGSVAGVQGMVRTMAGVVTTLEVVGCINLTAPLLIAVSLAVAIGNSVSVSIFDVFLALRKSPYVPSLGNQKFYQRNVGDIMKTTFDQLNLESKHIDVYRLLTASEKLNKEKKIAVMVKEGDSEYLIGCVKAANLIRYLEKSFANHVSQEFQSADKYRQVVSFFEKTKTIYEKEPFSEGDYKEIQLKKLDSKVFKGDSPLFQVTEPKSAIELSHTVSPSSDSLAQGAGSITNPMQRKLTKKGEPEATVTGNLQASGPEALTVPLMTSTLKKMLLMEPIMELEAEQKPKDKKKTESQTGIVTTERKIAANLELQQENRSKIELASSEPPKSLTFIDPLKLEEEKGEALQISGPNNKPSLIKGLDRLQDDSSKPRSLLKGLEKHPIPSKQPVQARQTSLSTVDLPATGHSAAKSPTISSGTSRKQPVSGTLRDKVQRQLAVIQSMLTIAFQSPSKNVKKQAQKKTFYNEIIQPLLEKENATLFQISMTPGSVPKGCSAATTEEAKLEESKSEEIQQEEIKQQQGQKASNLDVTPVSLVTLETRNSKDKAARNSSNTLDDSPGLTPDSHGMNLLLRDAGLRGTRGKVTLEEGDGPPQSGLRDESGDRTNNDKSKTSSRVSGISPQDTKAPRTSDNDKRNAGERTPWARVTLLPVKMEEALARRATTLAALIKDEDEVEEVKMRQVRKKTMKVRQSISNPIETFTNKLNDSSNLKAAFKNLERQISNEAKHGELDQFLRFWEEKIDFRDPALCFDASPICVAPKFWVSKLHFMYAMIGVTTVFVVEKGKMVGTMSKDQFLKMKREFVDWG